MNTTPKTQTYHLVPTLIAYAAFGALVFGVIYSQPWLAILGAVVVLPAALLLFGPALSFKLAMRNMGRHPENYETELIEDASGNVTSIRWAKVR